MGRKPSSPQMTDAKASRSGGRPHPPDWLVPRGVCASLSLRARSSGKRARASGARGLARVNPWFPREPPPSRPGMASRRLAFRPARPASGRRPEPFSHSTTLRSPCAPVAQGIERAPPEREVAGSIPAGRMKRHKLEVPQTPCSCGVCVWLQAFRRAGGHGRMCPGCRARALVLPPGLAPE